MAIKPGTTLNCRFEIIRKLDEGGMGAVYLALDKESGQRVAVKVLAPKHTRKASIRRRFRQEAGMLAQIDHPDVNKCLYSGQQDNYHYMVLEYVDGHCLGNLLAGGKILPVKYALITVVKVLESLDFCHNLKMPIVHRDLKPENIMISENTGQVILIDFGVARYDVEKDTKLTTVGTTVGTPIFMSPEQATDTTTVGPPSDQFSAAACLFRLLVGLSPYKLTNSELSITNVIIRMLRDTGLPIRYLREQGEVQPEIIDALERAMQKDPTERYPSCQAFANVLRGILYAQGVTNAEIDQGLLTFVGPTVQLPQFDAEVPVGEPQKSPPRSPHQTKLLKPSPPLPALGQATRPTVRPRQRAKTKSLSSRKTGQAAPPRRRSVTRAQAKATRKSLQNPQPIAQPANRKVGLLALAIVPILLLIAGGVVKMVLNGQSDSGAVNNTAAARTQARSVAEPPPSVALDADDPYTKGTEAYNRGDCKVAVKHLKQVGSDHPMYRDAQNTLAICQVKLGW